MINPRRPPKMKDIARAAGVSPMTVSRAFKSSESVSETTRALVLKAAEELNYVFDSTASNLRSQRSDFVAVTIPSLNNANFADTVGALYEGLKEHGLQILLGSTNYDIQEEEHLIEQLLRRRPGAIVVTGGRHTPRARRLLENAGVPVIETWDVPQTPIGHVVGFSNADAVHGLVDHFVSQGMSRIAFIGGEADGDTRGADRRSGFLTAMKEHGLDSTRLVGSGAPPISMREGAEAMGQLLTTLPDTEAVICVSDLSAFGALTECQRRGVDVPGRLSIAGFGNYEVGAVCVPSLTTINPFPKEIGSSTAELMLKLMQGEKTFSRQVKIAPELLIRDSSC